jgi:hypothetical protein
MAYVNHDAFCEGGVYPEQDISQELFANSYTIHIWNEYFRRNNVDMNAEFPRDSLC